MHRRNTLLALAALGASALAPWARAQSKGRLPRVAILHWGTTVNLRTRAEAFTRALRELGYADGRNIKLDWHSANGQEDLVNEIAAQLARESPEVIVSASAVTTRALHAVTQHTRSTRPTGPVSNSNCRPDCASTSSMPPRLVRWSARSRARATTPRACW